MHLLIECLSIYELMAYLDYEWEHNPQFQIWKEIQNGNGDSTAILETFSPIKSVSIFTQVLSVNELSYGGVNIPLPFNKEVLQWANKTREILSSTKLPENLWYENNPKTSYVGFNSVTCEVGMRIVKLVDLLYSAYMFRKEQLKIQAWESYEKKKSQDGNEKNGGFQSELEDVGGISSFEESPSGLSEGLWRRARSAGAFTHMEKRYGARLLFTYLAFILGHDLQTVKSNSTRTMDMDDAYVATTVATSDIPVNITSSSGVKVVNGVEKDLNIVKESTVQGLPVNSIGLIYKDENAVFNCLRAYVAVDNTWNAEDIFFSTVVAPLVQKVIPYSSSGVVSGSDGNELEEVYKQIKHLIAEDCTFLLQISSTGIQHVQFTLNHIAANVYVGPPIGNDWFEKQTNGTIDISWSSYMDRFFGGLQFQLVNESNGAAFEVSEGSYAMDVDDDPSTYLNTQSKSVPFDIEEKLDNLERFDAGVKSFGFLIPLTLAWLEVSKIEDLVPLSDVLPYLICLQTHLMNKLRVTMQLYQRVRVTLDSCINFALFNSSTTADYVAAQCLRRRIMYYHMEIFKNVDVIVTPTTGIMDLLLRVMDGSPENKSRAFEIAKFAAGKYGKLCAFIGHGVVPKHIPKDCIASQKGFASAEFPRVSEIKGSAGRGAGGGGGREAEGGGGSETPGGGGNDVGGGGGGGRETEGGGGGNGGHQRPFRETILVLIQWLRSLPTLFILTSFLL
ncbi:lecithin-cholesterol acyltransferase-like 4 protein [Tanacetum coccineum]